MRCTWFYTQAKPRNIVKKDSTALKKFKISFWAEMKHVRGIWAITFFQPQRLSHLLPSVRYNILRVSRLEEYSTLIYSLRERRGRQRRTSSGRGARLRRNFVLSTLFYTRCCWLTFRVSRRRARYKFAGKHTKIDNMTLDEVHPPANILVVKYFSAAVFDGNQKE